MPPKSKTNPSPPTISYAALETRGKHPSPGALHLSLKEQAKAVRGVEECTNHLVLGFTDKDVRNEFLKRKEIPVAGTNFPIKPWPLPETVKIRLKKVGLEATSEDIAKEIRKNKVPLKRVILETCNEAPQWRNGHAHFFIAKDLVPKLPTTITVQERTVRLKVMPKKDSSPSKAPSLDPHSNPIIQEPSKPKATEGKSKGNQASVPLSSPQSMIIDPKPSTVQSALPPCDPGKA